MLEFKKLDEETQGRLIHFIVQEFVDLNKSNPLIGALIEEDVVTVEYLVKYLAYQILEELEKNEHADFYAAAYTASFSGFCGFLQKIDENESAAESLAACFSSWLDAEIRSNN